ncbi:hypothetical protein GCM10027093_09270 [Paraburkholderia jirisanensis]
MGEARRRGTREERAKRASSESVRAISDMAVWPVDEDLFADCIGIYLATADTAAASRVSRMVHAARSMVGHAGISFNQGLKSVGVRLKAAGIDERTISAIALRLMHFGDVLRDETCAARWIEKGDVANDIRIDAALVRACASARIIVDADDSRFDLNDVVHAATRIQSRMASGEPAEAVH